MGSKQDGLDIGNRMKAYENCFAYTLPRRIPVIIRVDGRAFHTITRKEFGRTWSIEFVEIMIETAKAVMADIAGCDICYSQSDEISFLLTDYRTIKSEGWFGYDLHKLISISASLASTAFSKLYGGDVCFDSRCFSIPQDDVCNYFIWRQIDAIRNATQMIGHGYFSQKELHKVSCAGIQEKLLKEHNVDFNDYPTVRKRGFCIVKKEVDLDIPLFTEDRSYIEKWVYIRED